MVVSMPWTVEGFNNLFSAIASMATTISLVVGGIWVYRRYIREEEKYPHIQSSANMEFVGKQDDFWIVELIGTLENKGKVQHKISQFNFDLNAINDDDRIEVSKEWGGQVSFPHKILDDSFLPHKLDFFFIDPGVKAKYSYIVRVPKNATFLIFHCWFSYADQRGYSHTAERTVKVPTL
jgi:hypothetical protein